MQNGHRQVLRVAFVPTPKTADDSRMHFRTRNFAKVLLLAVRLMLNPVTTIQDYSASQKQYAYRNNGDSLDQALNVLRLRLVGPRALVLVHRVTAKRSRMLLESLLRQVGEPGFWNKNAKLSVFSRFRTWNLAGDQPRFRNIHRAARRAMTPGLHVVALGNRRSFRQRKLEFARDVRACLAPT